MQWILATQEPSFGSLSQILPENDDHKISSPPTLEYHHIKSQMFRATLRIMKKNQTESIQIKRTPRTIRDDGWKFSGL